MRRKDVHTMSLRLPPELHARLAVLARLHHRAVNGEIAAALEHWLLVNAEKLQAADRGKKGAK
jgi:predicted transcriptional regulator